MNNTQTIPQKIQTINDDGSVVFVTQNQTTVSPDVLALQIKEITNQINILQAKLDILNDAQTQSQAVLQNNNITPPQQVTP